nr:CIC_HP1_G0049000.mRNA.1.CDS.1 [Saccharomyces cerevisiae]
MGNLVEDQLTDDQKAILEREYEVQLVGARAAHDNGEHRIPYRPYLVSGINRTYSAPDATNRRLLDEGMTWEKQLDMVHDLERALEVGLMPRKYG